MRSLWDSAIDAAATGGPYLLAFLTAAAVVVCAVMVLERLEDRRRGKIGPPATALAILFSILIVSVGRWRPDPHLPYFATVVLLLCTTAIAWQRRRRVGHADGDTAWSKDPGWSSPSFIFLAVCLLVVGVLWVVQAGVTSAAGIPARPFRAELSGFLAQFTAAGVLAMATIQGIRGVLPVRGAFHRFALERWIDESKPPKEVDPKRLLASITEYATATPAEGYAFFDLPIEQLCGQIAAGADRLLDDPPEPPPASDSVPDTGGAAKETARPADKAKPSVEQVLVSLAADAEEVASFMRTAKPAQEGEKPREHLRHRANVSQRIQRNIDRLQIDTSFWWKRLMRGLAFVICLVIGLAVFDRHPIAATLCAVVGGFVASVARDLVAIVEKLRK